MCIRDRSRSGDFFAFEKSKVKPDIVPIAKGIGGGFPIGAVLMNKKVAAGMTPGTHGSTFGGNPLAMAVGNTVMDIVSSRKFLNNVKKLSKMIRKHSKIPIGVGFGIKSLDDVKKVSKLADLVVCGSSIVEKIKEGSQNGLNNKNLAQFVGEYVRQIAKGIE